MARRRRDPSLSASEEREVSAWSMSVRVEVLLSRRFGHSWTRGLTTFYRIGSDLIQELGCERCGLRRRDVTPLDEYTATRRSYEPPPDYRRERGGDGGSVRVPRWAVKDSLVNRCEVGEPPESLVDWYYRRDGE